MDAQTRLARVEVQRDSLHEQVSFLKAAEAGLIKEREVSAFSLNLSRIRQNKTADRKYISA